MVKIKFIEDFAGRTKGEEWECDSMIANTLIRADKVAVLVEETPKEQEREAEPKVKKPKSK